VTDQAIDVRIVNAVDANVKNWDESAKPPYVKNSSVRTYIIDPANAAVDNRRPQICDYEPRRVRLAIYVVDAAVALTTEVPTTSPDASTASSAPQGGYLPVSIYPYEFFGPDAFWLNALSAVSRVLVIKEYC
jgi:hypothetical protein